MTRTLQPARTLGTRKRPCILGMPLSSPSSPAPLLHFVALRFSECPPFVRYYCLSPLAGVQRALRPASAPGIPKFACGRTFERSSVKKSAAPLESHGTVRRVRRGLFSSFYYVVVRYRWMGFERVYTPLLGNTLRDISRFAF